MNIDEFVTKEQFDEIRTVDNFDNNAILKNRWNRVDELLSTFYTKNQKLNKRLYDSLQDVFNWIKFEYSELSNYASTSDIAMLRRKIDDVKDEYGLDGYIGYELIRYTTRKKLKNEDILLALITLEYYKNLKERDKEEKVLFDEIKNVVYKEASVEARIVMDKELPKKDVEYDIPKSTWIDLLTALTYRGFNWFNFKVGTASYNANKLYELVVIHLQQNKPINIEDDDVMKLFTKQERAYLNKKDIEVSKEDYKDYFSGHLDNEIAYLTNKLILQATKNQGCKKVRFVAVIDKKTTDMCRSLDKQVFSIDGYNEYYRYSAIDDDVILYKSKGLVLGANLPPIDNHFHWCRSTIIPYK